jgi:hypothetical protein
VGGTLNDGIEHQTLRNIVGGKGAFGLKILAVLRDKDKTWIRTIVNSF